MNPFRVYLAIFISLLFSFPLVVSAQDTHKPLPAEMQEVYRAFRALQPYLLKREEFFDKANEQEISKQLNVLSSQFHKVQEYHLKDSTDPGFANTLKVVNETIDDSKNRFNEGKKGYALWRLRTTSTNCINCHSRFAVAMDFDDPDLSVAGMSSYERGELYFATRQFEKAKEAFVTTVKDPEQPMFRLPALRKWLIISTRVDPNPRVAITELTRIRSQAKLTQFEDEEVQGWLESLHRWEGEGALKVSPIAKAENLVRQGLGMNDPLMNKKGSVELLRATAMLHKLLDRNNSLTPLEYQEVLYLLGLAYSELPFFFDSEYAEMFLEQCIREYPGTDYAKRSYGIYKRLVTLDYTGSGGTRFPDEVYQLLNELHDLAYGIPNFKGQA